MNPPGGAGILCRVGGTRPVALYVLAIILIHTLGHFAYMGLWRHVTAPDFDVNDFKAYYTAGLAVRTGQAATWLYSDPERLNLGLLPDQPWVRFAVDAGIPHPSAYIYPPFLAVVVSPLTLLPYHAANLAWFALNTLLLAASLILLARLATRGAPDDTSRMLQMVIAVFVCLNFFPTLRAMRCGQIGFVLLFLCTAALALITREAIRPGDDRLAGLCLALAAAIKLTPVVLILFLAWAGRRRAAAWGAGLFGALTALSIAIAGWGNMVLYVTGFLPHLSRGAATYANQSINGFLNRLLTEESMSVFDFSSEPRSVWLLTRLGAVALLVAAFVLARPGGRRAPGRRLALGYGLVVLTSLLISPISWEHHYVLALIPLSLMIAETASAPTWGAVAMISVAYTAMAVDAFELVRTRLPRGSRPAMSYVLYGGVLLWWMIASALSRDRRTSAA